MESSSGSSFWTLSGEGSLSAYADLQETALNIIGDITLADDVLLDRAKRHLQVFEKPEFAAYNRAKWMKNVSCLSRDPERAQDITARRFFDAMVQTADEFDLRVGKRFPAAEVCACALRLEASDSRCASHRLAEELSTLIFDIWWTSLWWPFADLGIWTTSPIEHFSRKVVQDVLLRDNCTCFVTGIVFKKPERLERLTTGLGLAHETTDRLDIAPIFIRPVTDPGRPSQASTPRDPCLAPTLMFAQSHIYGESATANDYRSLHLYRTFGQLALDAAVPRVDISENCLLLEHKAYLAFRLGKWTLVPTEEPNKYKIRTYVPPEQCFGPSHQAEEFVSFTEPSASAIASPGTTAHPGRPPNPDLLLAHAIFAHFLDTSGLGSIIFPVPRKPGGVTAEIINEQARSLLLPHLPAVKPVPKAARTWLPTRSLSRRLSRGSSERRGA